MIQYFERNCNYDIKNFIYQIIKEEYHIDYWDEWLQEQKFNELMEYPNYFIYALDNDVLVGTCSIKKISDDTCLLGTFYVKSGYRRKGVGTYLFNKCEKYAKDYGFKKIILHVDPNFHEAISFYNNRSYIYDNYNAPVNELNYHKYFKVLF